MGYMFPNILYHRLLITKNKKTLINFIQIDLKYREINQQIGHVIV